MNIPISHTTIAALRKLRNNTTSLHEMLSAGPDPDPVAAAVDRHHALTHLTGELSAVLTALLAYIDEHHEGGGR